LNSWPPQTFLGDRWQMSLGERAVVEGLLCQLKPALAVEIGTAQGGSLERIAAHSQEVHSIDIAEPQITAPANAQLHVGDSRALVPDLMRRFEAEGRNVDFVLVDGDHSPEGVRADVVNLLSSPALGRTTVLLHDTLNEAVRAGLEDVEFQDFPNVAYVHLDFVCGYMVRSGPFARQLWGGMGLVLVDATGEARRGSAVVESAFIDAYSMFDVAAWRRARRSAAAPLRALGRRVRGTGSAR
jgi:hypothetical protein